MSSPLIKQYAVGSKQVAGETKVEAKAKIAAGPIKTP